ncbi:DAB adaptor protein isoform X2 [Rhodnius prolixus]|uniref:DAB adaptor protein isoform X2 n=1 Tax=Rhodnius prolixus TaxID=13249 RepID=UPI003D18E21A
MHKNEPARFLGDGVSFKAKLIGILEVSEARGDRMCQEALADLKMAIRAAGEHKQRININIAIDGLRLRDEKTGDCLYHHPVHKISFIAQDMSDSRAFGYIFGSPDTGHRFFGIKTDKAASQVVITMRDLFQVVFELKKKEIEMAKQHIEQHQVKYSSPLFSESASKMSSEPVKIRPIAEDCRKESSATSDGEQHNIMDLLDLELELNNIQQGINQMDRITPSDPFGPARTQSCSGGATAAVSMGSSGGSSAAISGAVSDPFGDSFTVGTSMNKLPPPPESGRKTRQCEVTRQWLEQQQLFDHSELPQTYPLVNIPTESTNASGEENPARKEFDLSRGDQFDVFTDLDPLGTGRSKPYVDKKDFFQDLKNPPKKVLKDLVTEVVPTIEPIPKLFSTDEEPSKIVEADGKESLAQQSVQANLLYQSSSSCLHFTNDPFKEDPFEKDPFSEVDFSKTSGVFTPVSNGNSDPFEKFENFEKFADFETKFVMENEKDEKPAPLRVSLPPEKLGTSESSPLSKRKLQRGQSMLRPASPRQRARKTLSEVRIDSADSSSVIRQRPTYSTTDSYVIESAPEPPPRTSMLSGPALKPPPLPPKKVGVVGTVIVRESVANRIKQPDYDYIENYESRSAVAQDVDSIKGSMVSPPLPTPARKPKRQETDYYLQPFPLLPPPKKKPPKDKTVGQHEEELAISNVLAQQTAAQPLDSVTPNKSLDITLSQLTKTGFSELAASLNMSPTSLSKMTLQELTKCLASLSAGPNSAYQVDVESLQQGEKTTNESATCTEPAVATVEDEELSFKAEFDVHFSTAGLTVEESQPSDECLFDKYAVFRELLEEERRQTDGQEGQSYGHSNIEQPLATEVEDRYAALRDICLDEVIEEKYEELSDKDDSPVDRSRTEEDTDLLPSRPHSQSTDSPTITIKEHQVAIGDGTILEKDSVCETGKEGVDEGIFSGEPEDNGMVASTALSGVNALCDNTSSVGHVPIDDTSWAKFDCHTETRASSSIHSDGHVSPWSTESKENDLSPCNNKRRHRKLRDRSGDWEDEESEEWDWRENGWSDADSLYGEASGPYGTEYWTEERVGSTGVPVRIRHRSSPWDSPWEEESGDWNWHGASIASHSRHGPSLRSQSSWHRPPPLPPPRNHSSSRESLACDEHHSYQKRSYRRAKWDDDRHRWRDWESKSRYYKDHRDWESEHSDHDRWSRPRSCDRARRHEDHDRRYSRTRDGHYSDIDRRKVQTMQTQKCRRKQNQTSPFEDDFTSQFTFNKESEPKSVRYDSHKKFSPYTDYREEKRSYQHSPFEDDFMVERRNMVGSASRSSGEAEYRRDRETELTYPRSRQSAECAELARRHRQSELELQGQSTIRKSESVNIFARKNDPFDDEFFCENANSTAELSKPIGAEVKWSESFAAFNFDNDHN